MKAKLVKPTNEIILIENGLIEIPINQTELSENSLATILANLAYFGYTLSKEACTALMQLDESVAVEWWKKVDKALQEITGENRKMAKYVVYKNFPQEVLDMSQSEYWLKQILMYIGLQNKYFVQEEKARQEMDEKLDLKVLHLATAHPLQNILHKIATTPNKWTERQFETILYIFETGGYLDLNVNPEKIVFKDNLILYATFMLQKGIYIVLKSATDVLRLVVSLSNGDFKTVSKFRKFKRAERRYLLNLLENTNNIAEDFARYPERWKRLLYVLHPADYNVPKVHAAYNELYNDNIETFNSKVETMLLNKDIAVLELLKTRPGDFMRRLYNVLKTFPTDMTVVAFAEVLPKLSVIQLLKIESFLKNANNRKYRTIAPKGNWTRLQVVENTSKFDDRLEVYKNVILEDIAKTIRTKVSKKYKSVQLFDEAKFVKLQTNDSELTSYGRGTVFRIPDNMTFIRTASYWQKEGRGMNTWFDNGWNFFDKDWKNVGTCCWNVNRMGDAAIFSGDPTNSKEMKGRACQMIDLYIDKLIANGIRYAVWNILCYSKIAFNQAEEVYAALQWGENAQKGKLFEPSRCQLSFQIKGDNLTKYIAYIDLVERKLVYLDANLKGNVQSADSNGSELENLMPAIVEYLNALPSIHDLFNKLNQDVNGTKITYSDKDVELKEKEEAYVFKTEKEDNSFTQLNISELLNS